MAQTVCHVCGTTENRSLNEHLAERHRDVMLDIESDPTNDRAVIHGELGLLGVVPPSLSSG